jgi:NAD(P)H-hydrate epimerase
MMEYWQRHSIINAMPTLPSKIFSVATVREIDRSAIEDASISGYTLMSRAAAAAVQAARQRYPDATRWQVVCGAGNNGGDGYAVARLAANDGIVVSAVAVVDPASLQGDAATAYGDFAAEGGVVLPWSGELDPEAALLMDGMLGNGLTRDVSGDIAAAVTALNAHPAPVIALDIPTGLHGDTGAVMGCAVHADVTVTFVGLKTGLFLDQGPDHCGDIVFADLDIPESCVAASKVAFRRISDTKLKRALKPRSKGAHKGDFGRVLVIGGGAGMPGAVRLCGEAALRAGAGRVSLATDLAHAAMLTQTRPELMSHAVKGAEDLSQLLDNIDVIAFGPGLGRSPWAAELYAAVAEDERPSVWDADALNWLAEAEAAASKRVITPHPGEAGTLLGTSASIVQSDRPAAINSC